jgi:hypothetical protein
VLRSPRTVRVSVRAWEQSDGSAMDTPAHYVHWSFILISVPNLVTIGVMLALFAAALVAPFSGRGDRGGKR